MMMDHVFLAMELCLEKERKKKGWWICYLSVQTWQYLVLEISLYPFPSFELTSS